MVSAIVSSLYCLMLPILCEEERRRDQETMLTLGVKVKKLTSCFFVDPHLLNCTNWLLSVRVTRSACSQLCATSSFNTKLYHGCLENWTSGGGESNVHIIASIFTDPVGQCDSTLPSAPRFAHMLLVILWPGSRNAPVVHLDMRWRVRGCHLNTGLLLLWCSQSEAHGEYQRYLARRLKQQQGPQTCNLAAVLGWQYCSL